MRTDHYIGLVRPRDTGWVAARGVGSALVHIVPPVPPCLICRERHASKRELRRAHHGHPDSGRAARQYVGVWATRDEAVAALLAELVPLYLDACAREDGDPPPLLILPPLAEDAGNAWDHLAAAIDQLDGLGEREE